MNPHFQGCGRGTAPLCLPYPHPNKAEADVGFQASSKHPCRSQAKESFTQALQVTVASARVSHAQAWKHEQFAYGCTHSQLDTHVSSPIPDTHFAHQLTVLLHTRGRPFLLVHTTYKIGTFQQTNPTDGTTVACKAQHTPIALGPT